MTPGIQLVRPERRPDVAQQILQHEAADARAGVDDGEDEQRLEHDGEVIPEADDGASAAAGGEDVGHAERERGRAAGAREERLLRRPVGQRRHLARRVTGKPQVEIVAAAAAGVGAHYAGRRIDGEVDAGLQGAGGDHAP